MQAPPKTEQLHHYSSILGHSQGIGVKENFRMVRNLSSAPGQPGAGRRDVHKYGSISIHALRLMVWLDGQRLVENGLVILRY